MSIKSFLDKIFKLPPVEQREDIRHFFLNKVANVEMATHEKDDTYIYFLMARTNFRIGLFLAAVFLAVYLVPSLKDSVVRHYTDGRMMPMVVVLKVFNIALKQAYLYVVLPFYVVMYRWNINPKKYDVLWFSSYYRKQGKDKCALTVLPWIVPAVAMGYGLVGYMYILPYGWIFFDWYRAESVWSLIFYMLLILWLAPIGLRMLLQEIFIFWRFLGPYEDTSRPKREK